MFAAKPEDFVRNPFGWTWAVVSALILTGTPLAMVEPVPAVLRSLAVTYSY